MMKYLFTATVLLLFVFGGASCRGAQADELLEKGIPIEGVKDLDRLIEHIGDSRMVMLGEASHGTLEFYTFRKEITKKLIANRGFDFVAVEGDWPAFSRVNRYVKGVDTVDLYELFSVFTRWPPWMWKNEPAARLAEWLRNHNSETDEKTGFYGMDMYAVEMAYLDAVEVLRGSAPDAPAREVIELLGELGRYSGNMHGYARAYAHRGVNLEDRVLRAREIVESKILGELDPREALDLERNMAVLTYAERHFRAMADPGIDSWNVRAGFMDETLTRLLEYYGEDSRGIVWAHNTHIGDARATTMAERGNVNIGQLKRESLGEEQVSLVGFGTATGTVRAGREWGSPGEVMEIPNPVSGSLEHTLSKAEHNKLLFLFDETSRAGELMEPVGHRAMGVVYNPETEHLGNFVPTVLPQRYDAFIFFQSTEAIDEWEK